MKGSILLLDERQYSVFRVKFVQQVCQLLASFRSLIIMKAVNGNME